MKQVFFGLDRKVRPPYSVDGPRRCDWCGHNVRTMYYHEAAEAWMCKECYEEIDKLFDVEVYKISAQTGKCWNVD